MIEQLNNFEYGPVIFYVLATLMLVAIFWKHRKSRTNPQSALARIALILRFSGIPVQYIRKYRRTGLVYPGKPPVQVTRPYKRIDGVDWLLMIWWVLIFCTYTLCGIILLTDYFDPLFPFAVFASVSQIVVYLLYLFTKWDRNRGYK